MQHTSSKMMATSHLPIQVAPASPPAATTTATTTSASEAPTAAPEQQPTSNNMDPQVILTTPTATTRPSHRRHHQHLHLHRQPNHHHHHAHQNQNLHHHHHHQHHYSAVGAKLATALAGGRIAGGANGRQQLPPPQPSSLRAGGNGRHQLRRQTSASLLLSRAKVGRQVIRASEYKNLRQSVPSLRRQRDVDKVEVVTEAARYIDHLHKTLIERFVLCGIPDSLKDVLGTDNAAELSSQHIMNLVSSMASASSGRRPPAASLATTGTTTATPPTPAATTGRHQEVQATRWKQPGSDDKLSLARCKTLDQHQQK